MKALEGLQKIDEIGQKFRVPRNGPAAISELAHDRLLHCDACPTPADPGFERIVSRRMGCQAIVISGHRPGEGAPRRWLLRGAVGGETIRNGATNVPLHSPLLCQFAGKVGERILKIDQSCLQLLGVPE